MAKDTKEQAPRVGPGPRVRPGRAGYGDGHGGACERGPAERQGRAQLNGIEEEQQPKAGGEGECAEGGEDHEC